MSESGKKRPFRFFMLAHVEKYSELDRLHTQLKNIKLGEHQIMYVAQFGPTVASPCHFYIVTSNSYVVYTIPIKAKPHGTIGLQRYDGYISVVKWAVQKCKNFIGSSSIDGVIYWGHGAGILTGSWEHRKQFLTIMDLVKYCLEPLRPKIFLADGCYFGILSSLYQISRVSSIKYVLASPSYHTWYGILDTNAFSRIDHNPKTYLKNLRDVTCEYQARTWPKYRCFIVVEMKYIPPLVKRLSRMDKSDFKFTGKTRISRKDVWTHDLYLAVADIGVKRLVEKAVKNTCGLESCVTIHGVSIDAMFPKVHKEVFRNTDYYVAMRNTRLYAGL